MLRTRSPRSATPSPPLPTSARTRERDLLECGERACAGGAAVAVAGAGADAGGFIGSHLRGLFDELGARSLPDPVKDRARADVDARLVARGPVCETEIVVDDDGPAIPFDGLGRTLRDALAAERAPHHAGAAHDGLFVLGD